MPLLILCCPLKSPSDAGIGSSLNDIPIRIDRLQLVADGQLYASLK